MSRSHQNIEIIRWLGSGKIIAIVTLSH